MSIRPRRATTPRSLRRPATRAITFLAATGDTGTPSGYPAFSPNVVAVGGTSLTIQTNGTYVSETPWNNSTGADGGGTSIYEPLPSYQDDVNGVNQASTSFRNVPDISMDADPDTGVYVRDTFGGGGWWQVGGTSLATPLMAGVVAVANQGRAVNGLPTLNGATQTLPALYSLYGNSTTYANDFHDVTTGSNGTYPAGTGYDLATGIGTPIANTLVPALANTTIGEPPSISAPSSVSVSQDSGVMFVGNNTVTMSDPQVGSSLDSFSLSVSHGTMTLEYTGGLTFTSGAERYLVDDSDWSTKRSRSVRVRHDLHAHSHLCRLGHAQPLAD